MSTTRDAPERDEAAFLLSTLGGLAAILLTVVDVRRGFLFTDYALRTPFALVHPYHLPMLLAGIAAFVGSLRQWGTVERSAGTMRRLAAGIAILLVADLFIYRLVPASRSLASGQINTDWLTAFGAVGWWRPIALGASYALTVWHATVLGILLSALAATALPAMVPVMQGRSLRTSLAGALLALPHPFCSCCSSSVAPSLVRRGASAHFVLAFVVASPMLNVTTIALAVAMLPSGFAVIRIVGGVVVAVLVTFWVARLSTPWSRPGAAVATSAPADRAARTPSGFVAAWLTQSAGLAAILIPTVVVSSVLASLAFESTTPLLDNSIAGIALAALAGTLFMVPTWAEIPIALRLLDAGLTGPAAALLIALPAVSLPCMVVLGTALQRVRVVVLLAGAVMLTGVACGLIAAR